MGGLGTFTRAERENNARGPVLYSLTFIGEIRGKIVVKDRTFNP